MAVHGSSGGAARGRQATAVEATHPPRRQAGRHLCAALVVMSSVQSVSNRGQLQPEKAREAELEDVLELALRGCRRLICEAGTRGGLESLRQELLRGEQSGALDDADREAVERLQVVAAPTKTLQGAEQLVATIWPAHQY